MRLTVSGLLGLLGRSWQATLALPLDAGTEGAGTEGGRMEGAARGAARQLAKLLSSLWPSPLYACRVTLGAAAHVEVLDGKGKARPEWIRPSNPGPAPSLAGMVVVLAGEFITEKMRVQDQAFGEVGLVIPAKTPAATKEITRELLRMWAGFFAARLSWMGTPRPADPRLNQCNQMTELAGPVVHEFNNFLNTVVLQAAVLESQLPKEHLPDLSIIRSQARAITGVIKRFQHRRDRARPSMRPLDLNEALRRVAASFEGAPIRLELATEAPLVLGTEPDLHCLFTFLLNHALTTIDHGQDAGGKDPHGKGTVLVRTEPATDEVRVCIEDPGPPVEESLLSDLFDATRQTRAGADSLELAAAKGLAGRLLGRIRAENRSGGGFSVIVELPALKRP